MTELSRDHRAAAPVAGRFTVDSIDSMSWPAVRFGPTWNGFATPVVTKQTLRDLLAQSPDDHRWEGDIAVVWPTIDLGDGDSPDPETIERIQPLPDGMYDLGVLGWTFERV